MNKETLYAEILSLLDYFFTIISPPFCSACGVYLQEKNVFCVTCAGKITPIVSKTISVTDTKKITLFAISKYEYPLKRLILAKHGFNQLASMQLGELIWERTDISSVPFDIIVPIPLHWMRYAARGFNQADEIAKVIAKKSGKPIMHLLKRIKRTQFQAKLNSHDREKNVSDAFECNSTNLDVSGKHILLVDDLMTTSATIQSAAKKIFQLRPASITVVVACRTS